MSKVVLIGLGDMGTRLAHGLVRMPEVHELVLCGRTPSKTRALQRRLVGSSSARVSVEQLDAGNVDAVAGMLRAECPDLVVMCASPRGPWDLLGRTDRAAQTVVRAGFGLRLPLLLGLPWSLMRAAREVNCTGPVANLSYPDVTGPVLAARGLAPTIGLGNVGMIHVRAKNAARQQHRPELVRIIAHHSQVAGALQCRRPTRAVDRPRTYLGENGHRGDDLLYRPPLEQQGPGFNRVTAEASLPVLQALLPGAGPLRWCAPSPHGLPGGYPVGIVNRDVRLDLPPSIEKHEAITLNRRWARADGIENIDADGTVHFTSDVHQAVADLDPQLAAPLRLEDVPVRLDRLNYYLDGNKP
jgi:Saccharopine dehydrogenase NADP binding domain